MNQDDIRTNGSFPPPFSSDGGMVDRFRIGRFIGRGPLTAVYAAEDTVSRNLLALKILPEAIADSRDTAIEFRKALVGVAHFSHRHFVHLRHLHEVWEIEPDVSDRLGVAPGSQVLLTDLVTGMNLADWAKTFPDGRVPQVQAVQILLTIAPSLDAAHLAGFIHGFLSGANILLDEDADPVITDLGVARQIRESLSATDTALAVKAEPRYSPPERNQYGLNTPAGDQYALAALYCDMVQGTLDNRLSVPANTGEAAILRALSEEPIDRFESCEQFAVALNREIEAGQDKASPLRHPEPSGDKTLVSATEPESEASLKSLLSDEETPTPLRNSERGTGLEDPRGESDKESESPVTKPDATPKAPPPAIPSIAAERGKQKRRPRFLRVTLNIAIVVGLTLAVALLIFAILRKHPDTDSPNISPDSGLESIADKANPARHFVQTIRMRNGFGPESRIQGKLVGQSRILRLDVAPGMARITEQRSVDQVYVLAETAIETDLPPDGSVYMAKGPTDVGIYANGARLCSAPCPLEEWRSFSLLSKPEMRPEISHAYQKIGALVFADDFMHGDNELGAWEPFSDNWTVHAIQNPIRSANPFSFLGRGKDAIALAGTWFWRNYTLECAVHPLEGSAFGLKFCHADPENTYELIWGKAPDKGHSLMLLKVMQGKRTVLKQTEVNVHTEQWLKMSVSQIDGLITVRFDDRTMMEVQDPAPLFGGRIALWSRGGEGTVFDDVSVHSVNALSLDPRQASLYPSTLLTMSENETGTLRNYALPAVALQNVLFSARMGNLKGQTSPIEMAVRKNGSQSLQLRLSFTQPGMVTVRILTFDGQYEKEQSAETIPIPDGEATIAFHVHGRQAWCEINDVLAAYAEKIELTKPGTCSIRVPETLLVKSLNVDQQELLPAIENRVETFTHEESMQNWNSPVLEWSPDYANKLGGYWHMSDFWHDVAVAMDVDTMLQLRENAPAGVILRWPDGGEKEEGPQAALTVLPEENTLELTVGDLPPKRHALVRTPRTIELEQRCNRLLVRLNGDLLWNEGLPAGAGPLRKVGRIGRGASDTWAEAVNIRADGVRTYSFKEAPTDWLPASGTWQVTNRWQCDPRWSFFSGVQREGIACNWNKIQHGSDVSIEFFAGPKMDQDRGKKYEYAADINAVLAADGHDINSGYSFMFGGWDDRGSQIVRGSQILKENRLCVIPRKSSTHRRWFHIKMRKFGKRLSFWVDGALIASTVDENPLTGNRFGLWTWDNGIMVAQLRLSTTGPMEVADTAHALLAVPKTPYDSNKQN